MAAFKPDYQFNPDAVRDALVSETANVELSQYIFNSHRLHVKERVIPFQWLHNWARPGAARQAAEDPYRLLTMGANFLRGVHLGLRGLELTSAHPAVRLFWPANVYHSSAPLRTALAGRDKQGPPINIWLPCIDRLSDQSYAEWPSHHAVMDEWSERVVKHDIRPSPTDEVYFKRGYSLTLSFARAIVNAEVQTSFNDYMTQTVFTDEAERTHWQIMERALEARPQHD